MKPVTRHVIATTLVLFVGAIAAFAIFVWSGVYNVAADEPHTAPVLALLTTMRERSMETRAEKIQVPDLNDPAQIVNGAGNYQAMCEGCHLAPGMDASEISKGLYPTPPNLSKEKVEPEHAYWAIKHGIKASGMPAWGKSMDEQSIWSLTAFLQKLPTLDEAQYRAMVEGSGGHSHGGGSMGGMDSHGDGRAGHHHEGEARHHDAGEAGHHDSKSEVEHHDEAAPGHHPDEPSSTTNAAEPAAAASSPTATSHTHADGTRHQHKNKSK